MAAEKAARDGDATVGKRLATEEARLADLAARIGGFERDLADAPDLNKAVEIMAEIATADAALDGARRAADQAAQAIGRVRMKVDAIGVETTAARRSFDQSRDRVASLEPPVPERVDLAADWKELRDWATATIARLTAESAAAEQLIEDLQRRLSEHEGSLTALVEEEGLNARGPADARRDR